MHGTPCERSDMSRRPGLYRHHSVAQRLSIKGFQAFSPDRPIISEPDFVKFPAMTNKLYFTTDDLSGRCIVTSSHFDETAGLWRTRLESTLFHPQGGGQAGDAGTIAGIRVVKTVFDENGDIVHLTEGEVPPGEADATVDAQKRLMSSRLHTAGHLLAQAGSQHGWTAFKGDHREGESRVVFHGPEGAASPVPAEWQPDLDRLIADDMPLHAELRDGVRTVSWGFMKPVPCGGTHVRSTSQVGRCLITKMKLRKGELSVSYRLED